MLLHRPRRPPGIGTPAVQILHLKQGTLGNNQQRRILLQRAIQLIQSTVHLCQDKNPKAMQIGVNVD